MSLDSFITAPDDTDFVTDGIESAVARAKETAVGGDVGVHGTSVAQRGLNVGLLHEAHIMLVPVLLGSASGSSTPWPSESSDITHLRFEALAKQ